MDLAGLLKQILRPIYRNRCPIEKIIRRRKISKVSQEDLNAEQLQRFAKIGLDWDEGRLRVEELLGPNRDPSSHRSEHYELFAALATRENPSRILEIGTAEGDFTTFLATIFPQATIETIDLSSYNPRFWNATNKNIVSSSTGASKEDIHARDEKLRKFPNISFIEMNSLALTYTEKETYDFVWVDGDHTFPVVGIDIANALRIVKPAGLVGLDDIYLTPQRNNQWVGQELFETLNQFKNSGLINYQLILKRLFRERNYDLKNQKFIAVASRTN